MNFFDAQDRARRTTRRLVAVYVAATILIVVAVTTIVGVAIRLTRGTFPQQTMQQFVADAGPLLMAVAVVTTLFIVAATLYKTSVLSVGGGRVAVDMGGTPVPPDVSDPLRRRLRNVVEEMAIASGVPVPEIYVLEQERSINAFAAGFSPGDAAVAVTRGTLELLDRDELQGVIAHEFSHILNGDMRLNIRLMGVLFGIMVIGLIGRMILRAGHRGSVIRNSRERGAPVVLLVGLGLAVVGGMGVFMARLIKASVSRQREFLADASAVQFTRQTEGIANALKKIGGYAGGSYITSKDPEEIGHMLFGSGARLRGMFATHPPLPARIRRLDPGFDPADMPTVELPENRGTVDDPVAAGRSRHVTSAIAAGGAAVLPESIADTVGNPEVEHVDYAEGLRGDIPAELYDAAHSRDLSLLLALSLVLGRDPAHRQRQLAMLAERIGDARSAIVRRYHEQLAAVGDEFRLPLLEVAFPTLKQRPVGQLSFLIDTARRLVEIDGDVDLFEYCYYRILYFNIGQAAQPTWRARLRRAPKSAARTAALELLRVLAMYGHDGDAEASAAFAAGAAQLGDRARDSAYEATAGRRLRELDRSLDVLMTLSGDGRRQLLRAVSATAAHDGRITVREAELVRAVCATLDLPLPPILVRPDAA